MFLFTTPTGRETAARETSPAATPVVDAIRQGAEKSGVGFDYLLSTAQRESALDPAAKARTSSATGLFQFIEQTWLAMIKTEGDKAGVGEYARAIQGDGSGGYRVEDPKVRQEILALRKDPAIAATMAGALTQKNRDQLTADLGRPPSDGELYIAHVLGGRGAADLIRAAASRPDGAIADRFPEAAAANRSLFFDRSGRARGAGEVYALLAQMPARSAAPAFAPDRPVAFARQDGPAFHGLFQSAGRTGPISDAVAKLWRTGRPSEGARTVAVSFFPTSALRPTQSPAPVGDAELAPAAAAPAVPLPPLPPPRPKTAGGGPPAAAARPLDLASFMRWRKA